MAANTKALKQARLLRKQMTKAERILWEELRGRKLGVDFRRQMPFVFGDYHFIADFYCARKKIIIEIDGQVHYDKEIKEYDILREDIFTEAGYKIIRFKNEEVKNNLQSVIEKIKKSMMIN